MWNELFCPSNVSLADWIALVTLFISLLTVIRGWARRQAVVDKLLAAEDERDTFRKELISDKLRLGKIDPLKFVEKIATHKEKGEIDKIESLAQSYFSEQSYAISEASKILAEKEIFESRDTGNTNALINARRYVDIALAAVPNDPELLKLSAEITGRLEADKAGEIYDLIPPKGLKPYDLINNALALYKDENFALAAMNVRRAYIIISGTEGQNSSYAAQLRGFLSSCLNQIGRSHEAQEIHQQAIDDARETTGPDKSAELATALYHKGLSFCGNPTDYTSAEPLLAEALAMQEKLLHTNSPDLELTRYYLGKVRKAISEGYGTQKGG